MIDLRVIDRLRKIGFSFHYSDENEAGTPEHWWCWCGPLNRWDVETGDTLDTQDEAILDALDFLADFAREQESMRATEI